MIKYVPESASRALCSAPGPRGLRLHSNRQKLPKTERRLARDVDTMPVKTCTFVLNPFTLFKRCVEVVDPEPPTTIPPAAIVALVIAIGVLAISQIHQHSPVKAAAAITGVRSSLGEAMEKPSVIKSIVLLLLVSVAFLAHVEYKRL